MKRFGLLLLLGALFSALMPLKAPALADLYLLEARAMGMSADEICGSAAMAAGDCALCPGPVGDLLAAAPERQAAPQNPGRGVPAGESDQLSGTAFCSGAPPIRAPPAAERA